MSAWANPTGFQPQPVPFLPRVARTGPVSEFQPWTGPSFDPPKAVETSPEIERFRSLGTMNGFD